MSRVTDRLSNNQSIIDIAKKQYEQKQHQKKMPGNSVPIPSKGLIYPENHPLRSGQIEIRQMTAYDEDILTNSTYIKQGLVLEKLLNELIITPNVDVNDLPVFDQEAILISARIFAYGDEYPIVALDPQSGNQLERTIKLSTLKFKSFNLSDDNNGEFEYQIDDTNFKFKFLNNAETSTIGENNIISKFLSLTIQEINGNRDKTYINDYIKFELRPLDSKKLRDYISNNLPGLDYDVKLEGEDGSTFTTRFQYNSEFFRV